MKRYNKLVRDKIPDIIRQNGRHCSTRVLSRDEYCAALDQKLNEELQEYQESKSIEELCDVMEVIRAIIDAQGLPWEEFEDRRKTKSDDRGAFENRIMLIDVWE